MVQIKDDIVDNILVLTLSGEFYKDDLEKLLLRILKLIAYHQSKRVMVDKRAVNGRLLGTESYFVISSFGPIMPRIHLAFVELKRHERLAEIQATSFRVHGLKNYAFFFDYAEAFDWLKQQRPITQR